MEFPEKPPHHHHLFFPESCPAIGGTLLGLQTLYWTWREVGCQGSAADCNCSFTFSASPRDFQDSRGTDASQLRSVARGGWIHPNLLQHRTSSIPELSSSPPWSQQSVLISRKLMKKATPLHPFSRQQNLFPGEGTSPWDTGVLSPTAAPALWPRGSRSQPGTGTEGCWLWMPLVACGGMRSPFPGRMDSFTPKQWQQNKRLLLHPRPCAAFGLC